MAKIVDDINVPKGTVVTFKTDPPADVTQYGTIRYCDDHGALHELDKWPHALTENGGGSFDMDCAACKKNVIILEATVSSNTTIEATLVLDMPDGTSTSQTYTVDLPAAENPVILRQWTLRCVE